VERPPGTWQIAETRSINYVSTMDVGRCFRDAFEIYKRNVAVLVVAAFLLDLLGLLSLLMLVGPLSGGLSLMTLRAVRSKTQVVDLGDMFRTFGRFGTLFGLFWVTLFPILLGLVLLVIPGLLLATIWMFPFFLVVDRGEGIFSSLSTSREMVRRAGFGNCLLLVVIDVALHLAPSAIPYAGIVLAWFVTPIGWLIVASAYAQLVESGKLPLSAEELEGQVPPERSWHY
jgi:hypothetical protein